MRKFLAGLLLSAALGVFGSAQAGVLNSATVTANCSSYTISVSGQEYGQPASVNYTLTLTDSAGNTSTVSDSIAVSSGSSTSDAPFSASATKAWGPFNVDFTMSGSASLVIAGTTYSTVAISFPNGATVSCASSPPPPPPCSASFSNNSNFNGTAVPAGSYLWFNANFTVQHIPSGGVTLDFTNGSIALTSQGTTYNLPVPNAKITFSPSASCTSTYFDSVTNSWITTVPVTGDDEIFLTGLAVQIPAGGLPGGANPVDFKGTLSAESDIPGISAQMKWGAAAYSSFTTDYNALQVKAGHQTACGMSNGDHAGTPEGVDNNNVPWKHYVVGGARGGGGSNFTGSWSGTIGVPVCP